MDQEKNTAQRLISIARGEMGYREKATNADLEDPAANPGAGNWTKYARDLRQAGYYNGNKNGYAWCDVFVDWCFFRLCGDGKTAQAMTCQAGPLGAACRYSAGYYRVAGRFFDSPKEGDQVFFGAQGRETHTGIVESVAEGTITVLEGNSADQVARRRYTLGSTPISGYGRPLYEEAEPDLDAVARQVIRGNWGNGRTRRERLAAAGYDPAAVQQRVNELMRGN